MLSDDNARAAFIATRRGPRTGRALGRRRAHAHAAAS